MQHFDFNNSGTLRRTPKVNSYPGTLSAKAADESYTHYTHKRPVIWAQTSQVQRLRCSGWLAEYHHAFEVAV